MGFYGHISNIQRTSMTFDKIYPNRTTMDSMVDKDGIYAGRYVLVEYDNTLESDQLPAIIQFDGLLYNKPAARDNWLVDDKDPTSPTSYLVKLNPLTVGTDMEENIVGDKIKAGITVVCPKDINFTVNDKSMIVSQAIKQYFKIAEYGTVNKDSYNLLYNYITKEYQLDESASKENKIGCAFTEVYYSLAPEDDTKADENYTINYAIDRENYDSARGYDSTVWQKTYVDGKAKYVMIAELNSVVPALGVVADAPTQTPLMPHFSKDSTNIYYELHMQPSWGFRIKAANPDLRLPMLDAEGNKQTGSGSGNIKARANDTKEYPSDEKVTWSKTTIGNNPDSYDVTYLTEQDDIGYWRDDVAEINGAIYYNKAGFDKSIISHSNEKDEIALTPTGRSGYLYYTHDSDGPKEIAPDMNELSIMLPSIGNTIADVWDLIYGGQEIYGKDNKFRNTTIQWEDAKKVQAKDGLRLVNNNSALGYTYKPEEVNTLAGVINSAQDIIGMIITDDYPVDLDDTNAIKKLNEDYIYYQNNKYYFKKPTYEYTPVNGDNSVEQVELANWEEYKDKAWWKDTNNAGQPDYIQEDEYRDNREYVLGVKVPGANDKGSPYQFKGAEYQKGKYYIWDDKDSKGNDLVDSKTKAPYHIYYVSNDEERDVNKHYMDLTLKSTKLEDKGVYYVPNKYYLGRFEPANIKDEADFNKKLADNIRLFSGTVTHTEYGLCGNVTELKQGDYNESRKNYYYYLTLSTCDWSEEEYRRRSKDYATRPVLFYSKIDSVNGTPQSYYVINKKYKYFNDKATIEASPGVYWYVEKNGQDLSYYVDENNYLKSGVVPQGPDPDVHMNEEYFYFREIVELELAAADQIVNINEAVIVEPKSLPQYLYQEYNEDGRVGYKLITAQSKEITQATNCGNIQGLYILEKAQELVVGYVSNTYYYQIDNENHEKYNSVIIDNRKEPDPETDYWTLAMINKRKLTDEEVDNGKQAGETYYIYDQQENTYVIYEGEKLETGGEYYVSSLSDAPEFYTANKYYYRNSAGEYILDTSEEFTEGREYFKNPQLYVIEDPNGFYDKGATWPLGTNPPEDSGIVLGKRKEAWTLEELKGFDVHFNTLHGLLLRLNQWMLQNDTLTRDDATLQGALNKLNDLIHRFGKMEAGQVMMVDDAGRMRGAEYSTTQWFGVKNYGHAVDNPENYTIVAKTGSLLNVTQDPMFEALQLAQARVKTYNNLSDDSKAQVDAVWTQLSNQDGESYEGYSNYATQASMDAIDERGMEGFTDPWISADVDSDYQNPKVFIRHNVTIVEDTTSASDLNISQSDTIDLYAPIVDNMGHVVGHNTETITLPYGYKKVNLLNTSSALDSPDDLDLIITDKVIANNTQDTLLFKAGNKWIKFDATSGAVNDTIHVYHETEDTRVAVTQEIDLNNGVATIGPVLQSFTRDRAGHVNDLQPIKYTLPNGYSQFKTGENAISNAQSTMDTFVFTGDDWISPVVTQGNLTLTHINNNLITNVDTTISFGNQTPKFGEAINLMSPTFDANGHLINYGTDTVTLPTSITGLMVNEGLPADGPYLTNGISLVTALDTLQQSLKSERFWLLQRINDVSDAMVAQGSVFSYGDQEMTVEDLFAKVKELEDQVNALTTT